MTEQTDLLKHLFGKFGFEDSSDILCQLGLFLTLHKVEHAETFYRHIVGLRLANQMAACFRSVPDPNETLRAQTILAIAEFIKANPRCREEELQAEIARQIEAFAQAVE